MWSSLLGKSEESKAVEVGVFCSTYIREEVLRKRIEGRNDEGGKGKFVLVHGDFGT